MCQSVGGNVFPSLVAPEILVHLAPAGFLGLRTNPQEGPGQRADLNMSWKECGRTPEPTDAAPLAALPPSGCYRLGQVTGSFRTAVSSPVKWGR